MSKTFKVMRQSLLVCILISAISYVDLVCADFSNEMVHTIAESVVRLEVRSNGGKIRSGTGFVFGEKELVVTAYHVVAGAEDETIDAIFYENQKRLAPVKAEILRVFERSDLALLLLSGESRAEPLERSSVSSDRLAGTSVLALGFPFGRPAMTDEKGTIRSLGARKLREAVGYPEQMTIQALKFPRLSMPILDLQMELKPGFSGGPVVDEEGKLVGIANGGLRKGTSTVSWVVPASELEQLLVSDKENTAEIDLARIDSLYSWSDEDERGDLLFTKEELVEVSGRTSARWKSYLPRVTDSDRATGEYLNQVADRWFIDGAYDKSWQALRRLANYMEALDTREDMNGLIVEGLTLENWHADVAEKFTNAGSDDFVDEKFVSARANWEKAKKHYQIAAVEQELLGKLNSLQAVRVAKYDTPVGKEFFALLQGTRTLDSSLEVVIENLRKCIASTDSVATEAMRKAIRTGDHEGLDLSSLSLIHTLETWTKDVNDPLLQQIVDLLYLIYLEKSPSRQLNIGSTLILSKLFLRESPKIQEAVIETFARDKSDVGTSNLVHALSVVRERLVSASSIYKNLIQFWNADPVDLLLDKQIRAHLKRRGESVVPLLAIAMRQLSKKHKFEGFHVPDVLEAELKKEHKRNIHGYKVLSHPIVELLLMYPQETAKHARSIYLLDRLGDVGIARISRIWTPRSFRYVRGLELPSQGLVQLVRAKLESILDGKDSFNGYMDSLLEQALEVAIKSDTGSAEYIISFSQKYLADKEGGIFHSSLMRVVPHFLARFPHESRSEFERLLQLEMISDDILKATLRNFQSDSGEIASILLNNKGEQAVNFLDLLGDRGGEELVKILEKGKSENKEYFHSWLQPATFALERVNHLSADSVRRLLRIVEDPDYPDASVQYEALEAAARHHETNQRKNVLTTARRILTTFPGTVNRENEYNVAYHVFRVAYSIGHIQDKLATEAIMDALMVSPTKKGRWSHAVVLSNPQGALRKAAFESVVSKVVSGGDTLGDQWRFASYMLSNAPDMSGPILRRLEEIRDIVPFPDVYKIYNEEGYLQQNPSEGQALAKILISVSKGDTPFVKDLNRSNYTPFSYNYTPFVEDHDARRAQSSAGRELVKVFGQKTAADYWRSNLTVGDSSNGRISSSAISYGLINLGEYAFPIIEEIYGVLDSFSKSQFLDSLPRMGDGFGSQAGVRFLSGLLLNGELAERNLVASIIIEYGVSIPPSKTDYNEIYALY